MIDSALSVLPVDAGPQHVKLLLEWETPDEFFCDISDPFVEHESVSQLQVRDHQPSSPNKIVGPVGSELLFCSLFLFRSTE